MMTRSQFLRSLAGIGAGALVVACSDGDGDSAPSIDAPPQQPTADAAPMTPDAPPAQTCSNTTSTIGTNHGHTATVPAADVTAGLEKSYNIQGASNHPHTIVVTAAMFTMLKSGQMVTVTSVADNTGHTHVVTIACAA